MTIRFVHGAHIHRDGVAVVEVYDGEGLAAVLYPIAGGLKIVSRHFAPDVVELAVDKFPPAIVVRFAGATPPGRERFDA
jgi:hypothetical protein